MLGPWEKYSGAARTDAGRQAKEAREPADDMADFMAAELAQGVQPKSFGQEIGDFAGRGAQFADDTVRQIASGATFGFADKIAGALGGGGVDAERAKTEAAADRLGPWTSTAARIAGGLAPVGGIAGRIAAGGNLLRAVPEIGRIATNPASQAAATGAVSGAMTGLGEDRDIVPEIALGLGGGAAGHAIGNAISSGVQKFAGAFNTKPKIPTRYQLDAEKNAAYTAADDAGVIFSPQATSRLNQRVVSELADMGYDPALQPGAAAAVRRLQDLLDQNVTLKGLETVRRVAKNGFVPGNNSNNMAVGKIVDAIDDIIENPQSGEVLAGGAGAAAESLSRARNLASRTIKLDKVDDAFGRADLRAASTGSGGNIDNATRQNLRRLLEKPRGFSQDEKKALEDIVRGSPTQNALRLIGKLSPSGNGLMAALGIGGTMVKPEIGAAMLAGMLAKPIADRMTSRNVETLRDIIAAGGSRAAVQAPPNFAQRLADAERERLAKLLMGIGASSATQSFPATE